MVAEASPVTNLSDFLTGLLPREPVSGSVLQNMVRERIEALNKEVKQTESQLLEIFSTAFKSWAEANGRDSQKISELQTAFGSLRDSLRTPGGYEEVPQEVIDRLCSLLGIDSKEFQRQSDAIDVRINPLKEEIRRLSGINNVEVCPYITLGLRKPGEHVEVTPEMIRDAYTKLSKEYHPDRNPGNMEAEAEFKCVQDAKKFLDEVGADHYTQFLSGRFNGNPSVWHNTRTGGNPRTRTPTQGLSQEQQDFIVAELKKKFGEEKVEFMLSPTLGKVITVFDTTGEEVEQYLRTVKVGMDGLPIAQRVVEAAERAVPVTAETPLLESPVLLKPSVESNNALRGGEEPVPPPVPEPVLVSEPSPRAPLKALGFKDTIAEPRVSPVGIQGGGMPVQHELPPTPAPTPASVSAAGAVPEPVPSVFPPAENLPVPAPETPHVPAAPATLAPAASTSSPPVELTAEQAREFVKEKLDISGYVEEALTKARGDGVKGSPRFSLTSDTVERIRALGKDLPPTLRGSLSDDLQVAVLKKLLPALFEDGKWSESALQAAADRINYDMHAMEGALGGALDGLAPSIRGYARIKSQITEELENALRQDAGGVLLGGKRRLPEKLHAAMNSKPLELLHDRISELAEVLAQSEGSNKSELIVKGVQKFAEKLRVNIESHLKQGRNWNEWWSGAADAKLEGVINAAMGNEALHELFEESFAHVSNLPRRVIPESKLTSEVRPTELPSVNAQNVGSVIDDALSRLPGSITDANRDPIRALLERVQGEVEKAGIAFTPEMAQEHAIKLAHNSAGGLERFESLSGMEVHLLLSRVGRNTRIDMLEGVGKSFSHTPPKVHPGIGQQIPSSGGGSWFSGWGDYAYSTSESLSDGARAVMEKVSEGAEKAGGAVRERAVAGLSHAGRVGATAVAAGAGIGGLLWLASGGSASATATASSVGPMTGEISTGMGSATRERSTVQLPSGGYDLGV